MAKDFEFAEKAAADLVGTSPNERALRALINAWNSKNTQAGKRVTTFSFLAAALAACNGDGSDKGDDNGDTVVADSGFRLLTGTTSYLVT